MTYVRKFPVSIPNISKFSSLFADETRAAICGVLMSRRSWTVGELSSFCNISKSNATEQINKLIEGGVLKSHKQGRHKYVMIASEEIADLIEKMAQISNDKFVSPQSLNANRNNMLFKKGRTCYKHLAGEIGIELLKQLQINKYIDIDYQLTQKGILLLKEWGVKEPEKLVGKACMDTTERTFHLAGSLGKAICGVLLDRQWILHDSQNRFISLTENGYNELHKVGIDLKI